MIATARLAAARAAALEFWVVAALVAASILSSRLLPLAAGVAALFWLLRWVAEGRPVRSTPVNLPLLLLGLMCLVTLWATAVPEKTIPQTYRLLTGIALFYAIFHWLAGPVPAPQGPPAEQQPSDRRFRLALLGVTGAGLLLALAAPLSTEWAVDKIPFIPAELYQRFTLLASDAINPNTLGGNLVLLLPPALAALLFAWRHTHLWQKLGLALAALAMVAGVVLSQSRGAWAALVLVLLCLLLLRWPRFTLLISALAMVAGAAAVYAYQLQPRLLIEKLVYSTALGSLEGRLEIWSRAIYMIQDFPFTGVGLGTFGDVADVLYPFFLFSPGSVPHTHNIFLQVAVDLGLPGLIAWLSILLTANLCALQLYRLGRTRNQAWYAAAGAGLLASNLALVLHGLTDAVTWGMVRPAPIVWALWGIAIAGWQLAQTHLPIPLLRGKDVREETKNPEPLPAVS